MIATRLSSVTAERICLWSIRRFLWLGVMRKQWQREYSRTSCFWKKSSGTRVMPISRTYRFSNWQNALTCLTQEPCAPPEEARNLGRFGNNAGELPNTEVSDWVKKQWR